MARGEKLLTARGVAAIKEAGFHSDGGGLYLDVSEDGRRRWIFRYRFGDRRRDMGLGSAAQVSLAEARDARDAARALIRAGMDPIDARRSATPREATFGEVADDYMAAMETHWKNSKHRAQWRMTLEVYAAALRMKPAASVATADILAVLKPIWIDKPETASRVRGRIETVLDSARAKGSIDENRANPARWKGHLDKLLPARRTLSRGHHAAMPYSDVPAFVQALRRTPSVGALALEFVILTAARTSEVLEMTWGEIDAGKAVWTVPAARMKAKREHFVPLSRRASEVLAEMREVTGGAGFVFPGARRGHPLSNMALAMMMRKRNLPFTVHGFRSSFRDWLGEETNFPPDLGEAALAHISGDKTERAYRRGRAIERRRPLMEAWAAYVDGRDNVISLVSSQRGP